MLALELSHLYFPRTKHSSPPKRIILDFVLLCTMVIAEYPVAGPASRHGDVASPGKEG